jgi:thiosulfate/3-mercaptopyruvate sulfurtransferase
MTGPLIPSPLVSTQWLADHLGSDELVILDATVLPITRPNGTTAYVSGHDQYLVTGHIPGAVFADLIEVFSDPRGSYPFTKPDAELFAIAAGSVGIDNKTTVVVYDSVIGQWASRVWWLFRAFGYDRVAVLDGGLVRWIAEERETETGHTEPTIATFEVTERPELWVDKAFVESVVAGETNAALVCAAPAADFSGEAGTRARRGHIPGSHSIPVGRLVDRATNVLHDDDALRATFAPVLDQSRIVTYCGGGIAAASNALALTLLGHTTVAIYDGSLNEWAADTAAPLATQVAGVENG